MREIKFRGKSKLGLNPMVKGFYLYDEREDKHFISFKPDGDNFQLCPIEEETVGQFTGLKDKNGTEIYEGDIVIWDDISKGKYWRVAIVFFDTDNYACWSFKTIKNNLHELSTEEGYVFSTNFEHLNYKSASNSLEVIGNIHQNKELYENNPNKAT